MPVVTVDGPNKLLIEISVLGDNVLDIVDIYSDWKVWTAQGDNAKYQQALTPVGGDPVTGTQSLGTTYFLENGWRIRPAELDHRLQVTGNLFTREEGGDPFVSTVGNFNTRTVTSVTSDVTVVQAGGGPSFTEDDVAVAVWTRAIALHSSQAGSFAEALQGALDESRLSRRHLGNRLETDPVTGIVTLYADDGTTPLYTSHLWEDVNGTQRYRGLGAERRDGFA